MTQHDPAAAIDPALRPGMSLRDFWTDGSVSLLCATLSELVGVTIELRDEQGHVLYHDGDGLATGADEPIPQGARVFSVDVTDTPIGSVVVGPGDPKHGSRALAERAGELLSAVTREMCTDVTELRLRIKEIQVLYELNALLADGGRVSDTLELALSASLDTLGLDAGAIMLFPQGSKGRLDPDREDELERSASVGLSERWLSDPSPLSHDRSFDAACLSGEIVVVEDLMSDDRVRVKGMVVDEGLGAFIGAGMIFENRPIGVLRLYSRRARRFTRSERRLVRSIAQSAAMAVEQAHLLRLKARERRTQRAIKIAAEVQKRMLPESLPKVEGLDTAARFSPSAQIAGDFYDVFEVRDKLGILVGDVVGKGISAGLLMSAVRASLRAYAELSDDLSRVMERTNDAVSRDTTVSEFVTIWYGVYDPKTRVLSYVLAGHDPPLLATPNSDGSVRIERVEGSGLVAGVQPGERYTMQSVDLTPGQVLVAYTDGITDAVGMGKDRFGRERLVAAIEDTMTGSPGASAEQISERLLWHLRQFKGFEAQTDDETLVVLHAT